jgi:hypothetical protein
MTRTWLNRLLVIAPFVTSAALAQAQTPAAAPPAGPAKPAPAAPAARPAPSMAAPAPAPAMTKPAATTPPAGAARPAPAAAGAAKAPAAAATASAKAPAAPATPALKPAPELDQLKFLMGRWRCDGKQFGSPLFGPEHAFKATAESKPAVDNFWDQYTYEEKKSKDHHGVKVSGFWGWDQGAKKLVRVGASNAGDWDVGSAPGLEGDKIVWTGDFSGAAGRMGYRHTFTKKSDKEWSHVLEIKDPSGKFIPVSEVDCKR